MRRRYGVIIIFCVAFVALSLMCFESYRYATHKNEEKQVPMESELTSEEKEQVVTSTTKYIVEKYDRDTEETVEENRTIPPEYIGLSREQLENQLVEELATINKEQENEGLVNISLESFSREKIVVKETYAEKKPQGFILKLLDGEVAIYSGDGKELYEKTGIMQDSLSEEDCKILQKGYSIQNEKELYSILENFSS